MFKQCACIFFLSFFSHHQSFSALRLLSKFKAHRTTLAAAYTRRFTSVRPIETHERFEALKERSACFSFMNCRLEHNNNIERTTELIIDADPDIAGLSGVRDDKNIRELAELWRYLGAHGYEIIHFPSASADFRNVILYKTEKVTPTDIEPYWTPYNDLWNNTWEHLNLLVKFYPSIQKGKGHAPDWTVPPLYYINAHNNSNPEATIFANKMHVEKTRRLISERTGIVVIGGNLTSSINDEGIHAEQMAVFKRSGFIDLTKNDAYNTGTGNHIVCKANLPGHFITYWTSSHKPTTTRIFIAPKEQDSTFRSSSFMGFQDPAISY